MASARLEQVSGEQRKRSRGATLLAHEPPSRRSAPPSAEAWPPERKKNAESRNHARSLRHRSVGQLHCVVLRRPEPGTGRSEGGMVQYPFIFEINTVGVARIAESPRGRRDRPKAAEAEWTAGCPPALMFVFLAMGVWSELRRAQPECQARWSARRGSRRARSTRTRWTVGLAAARASACPSRPRWPVSLLDFVPNHVSRLIQPAEVHPAVSRRGGATEQGPSSQCSFVRVGDGVLAKWTRPLFAAWP